MRVLVACEFSGIVRDAFEAMGHMAVSCDLIPTERPGAHITGDVLDYIAHAPVNFDLLIASPPCTYLNHAGVRWLYKGGRRAGGRDEDRWTKMRQAAEFFNVLKGQDIPYIAIENSEMHPYARDLCGEPTQCIQPWQFGVPEFKATWLWLKGLPILAHTNELRLPRKGTEAYKRWSRVHRASPGADRWKERSRTLPEIAAAMAEQWGSVMDNDDPLWVNLEDELGARDKRSDEHDSDCAVHNAPALPVGPCTCGATVNVPALESDK